MKIAPKGSTPSWPWQAEVALSVSRALLPSTCSWPTPSALPRPLHRRRSMPSWRHLRIALIGLCLQLSNRRVMRPQDPLSARMWEEQKFAAKGHDRSKFFPVFSMSLRALTTNFWRKEGISNFKLWQTTARLQKRNQCALWISELAALREHHFQL